MAQIKGATNEKVFQIKQWRGLNECEDGDTKLKLGEATVMRNWRVTADGNLKRRPGLFHIAGLCSGYKVQEAEEAETVYTGDGSKSYELYTIANPNIGVVELMGDYSTMSVDEIIMSSFEDPVYFKEDMYRVYKLDGGTVDGDTYTLRGIRLSAVPLLGGAPVKAMWAGNVNGEEMFLAACSGFLWKIEITDEDISKTSIGALAYTATGTVHFFGFGGIVYILTGEKYYQYDGTTLQEVHGYRPLVAIAIPPGGGGELSEAVNLLCGERRAWLSPDGEGATFQLPEKGLLSVDGVIDLKTNLPLPAEAWHADLQAGTVTFTTTPEMAVNAYEVQWTVNNPLRSQVEHMRYSELYSGTQDNRVFLYGDGTNLAIYSGLDYNGLQRADYFPDQCMVHVGDANTPITAMIRHYSTLVAYKTTSTWSLTFGITTLADSSLTPAFYTVPVNRDTGNAAPGQVRLVNNSPISLFGENLYEWRNSSYYSSNLSQDERQARRISDRIRESLKDFSLSKTITWDDNERQEYYIHNNGHTLVWNYKNDAWYTYTGLAFSCMCNYQGLLMIGTTDGRVCNLNHYAYTDVGENIPCYWESGAMDFGADYMRKFSAMAWVGLQPENKSAVVVTIKTDRKDTFQEKLVSSERAKVDGEPFVPRTKLKAKKFVYYTLILESPDDDLTATVTGVDFRVRFTGYAKG